MRTIFLLGVILISLHSPLTLADAHAEREALARIIHELELLRACSESQRAGI